MVVYGPEETSTHERCAVLVDKILRGAKPGELPVERPTKIQLVFAARSYASCHEARLLIDPLPRVAEHPHPRPVLAPVVGMPGILDGAEGPFGVRH